MANDNNSLDVSPSVAEEAITIDGQEPGTGAKAAESWHDTRISGSNIATVLSTAPKTHSAKLIISEPLFYGLALERGLTAIQSEEWTTEAKNVEPVFTVGVPRLTVTSTDTGQKALIDAGDALLLLSLGYGRASAMAAAQTPAAVVEFFERVRTLLPRPTPSTAQEVPLTFHGSEFTTGRTLVVPTWEEIRGNYPASVAESLTALIKRGASQPGRLLLWHGLPGTGKTYALRSLAWEWREWCNVEYIVDPEAFFGRTDYMMGTLLADVSREKRTAQPKWRLLVAEDTGELLARDARTQVGQGLSRLLNVVDGLIGQGLRTMVLVTTNEKLEGMHEAVTRPGRTGSIIEFLPFAPDEANGWLLRHGKPELEDRKSRTLAELFAGARPQKSSIGFVPGGVPNLGKVA